MSSGFVIELLISAAVTVMACPVVRRLMIHRGVMDLPNHRSSHCVPTPRGGGLACAAGAMVGLAVSGINGQWVPWPVVVAAALVATLGLLDDHHSVPPLIRLAVQVLVGVSLGAALGGMVGLLIGGLVIPVSINVVNFMDGINGITGITMAVWGVSTMLVGRADDRAALVVLGGITAGSALGFLPWNLPSAGLFLGDVGSYLFGGLVAGGIILGAVSGARTVFLVAPLGLYLVDTGATLLQRVRRGAPLLEAHRDHTYQRLTTVAGLPHGVVALGAGAVSLLLTLVWMIPSPWVSAALTVMLLGFYLTSPQLAERLGLQSPPGRTPAS